MPPTSDPGTPPLPPTPPQLPPPAGSVLGLGFQLSPARAGGAPGEVFWIGGVLHKHGRNPTLLTDRMCLVTEDAITLSSGEAVVRRVPFHEVTSVRSSEGWVTVVSPRDGDIVLKLSCPDLPSILSRCVRSSPLLPFSSRAALPFLSFTDVPEALKQPLSILYRQGQPQLLWAGTASVGRREGRLVLVTPHAVYVGGGDGTVTRALSLEKVSHVAAWKEGDGEAVLFKAPAESDVIVEGATPSLLALLPKLFRHVYLEDARNAILSTVGRQDDFRNPAPDIPIRVLQPPPPKNPGIPLSSLPVVLRPFFTPLFFGGEDPGLKWGGHVQIRSGARKVLWLTPEGLFLSDPEKTSVVSGALVGVHDLGGPWVAVEYCPGDDAVEERVVFQVLEPPSTEKTADLVRAAESLLCPPSPSSSSSSSTSSVDPHLQTASSAGYEELKRKYAITELTPRLPRPPPSPPCGPQKQRVAEERAGLPFISLEQVSGGAALRRELKPLFDEGQPELHWAGAAGGEGRVLLVVPDMLYLVDHTRVLRRVPLSTLQEVVHPSASPHHLALRIPSHGWDLLVAAHSPDAASSLVAVLCYLTRFTCGSPLKVTNTHDLQLHSFNFAKPDSWRPWGQLQDVVKMAR